MKKNLYLVAGLGKTGLSIARYLKRRDLPFVVFDTRETVEGLAEFKTEFPDIQVFFKTLPARVYTKLKAIIASPGIALDEPFIQEAVKRSIDVYGDIECLAREITAPVIAVTGTNGKSTVTTLVADMARAAGYNVAMAGNIGTPVLDLLDDEHHYDLWVLELSSFQLELTTSLTPMAATILNVTPDHLDRHYTLDAYVAAKQRIYNQASFVLYNRDDRQTLPQCGLTDEQRLSSFGLDSAGEGHWGIMEQDGQVYLAEGDRCLLPIDQLLIKGTHNWQNALAACALASAAEVPLRSMLEVLQAFAGLPHRCQWVRTLDAVDWINDSKGTNIGATQSAIVGIGSAMQGKIVLIAGGLGKGADFTELRVPAAQHVRSVVLIGTDADKIAEALSDLLPIHRADSLDNAIIMAKNQAKPGDVVLLSPACASLDMFRDFNHRGDLFTSLVGQL